MPTPQSAFDATLLIALLAPWALVGLPAVLIAAFVFVRDLRRPALGPFDRVRLDRGYQPERLPGVNPDRPFPPPPRGGSAILADRAVPPLHEVPPPPPCPSCLRASVPSCLCGEDSGPRPGRPTFPLDTVSYDHVGGALVITLPNGVALTIPDRAITSGAIAVANCGPGWSVPERILFDPRAARRDAESAEGAR